MSMRCPRCGSNEPHDTEKCGAPDQNLGPDWGAMGMATGLGPEHVPQEAAVDWKTRDAMKRRAAQVDGFRRACDAVLAEQQPAPGFLTIRDRFAIAALSGIISSGNTSHCTVRKISLDAYVMADAMMVARGGHDGVLAERERCATSALDERVSVETGTPEDASYNRACEDIAARIRSGK